MKPERNSRLLLGATRAIAKMIEYDVPEEHREIAIKKDPKTLLDLTIGILGDVCADQRPGAVAESLEEYKEQLLFSSYYFDALLNSKVGDSFSDYLRILGASTYYLCDFPGSSTVLVDQIKDLNAEADGLDWLVRSLLVNAFSTDILKHLKGKYVTELSSLRSALHRFFNTGEGQKEIIGLLTSIRQKAYSDGSDRELLLADVANALWKKKLAVSIWRALPEFTGLGQDIWKPFLQKTDLKELWPAQLVLGKYGAFNGRSAVVQMPTSAGKTRATELIIRSAFLSGRTKLAVIVAPYRALCHEIYDGLAVQFHGEKVDLQLASDVLQEDLSGLDDPRPSILILTPEKLDYILRQEPKLAEATGLIVYDEGHLFDDTTRGVRYELLLASLKRKFTADVQVVLISAVIGNAQEISFWLTGKNDNCIIARDLHPTYRTVAFASWIDPLGRLTFVETEDVNKSSFFVPRILEKLNLKKKPREKAERVFPDKEDSGQIALYLGCKLVHNGAVAIFAGTKPSASSMADDIVDAFSRGLPLPEPSAFCDSDELQKLVALYERNLGKDCTQTNSARLGIFLHHAVTPHGIRLAVEFALQKTLVKFVICTSTLAQGVNLPLRYLIVTTDRQGKEKIRVRDFHNLMGRAGRAGMYTEGTVLFANPRIFDKKLSERWRWSDASNLLNPEKSEPCQSFILSLLAPFICIDVWRNKISFTMKPTRLAKLYYENRPEYFSLAEQYASLVPGDVKLRKENVASLVQQLRVKSNIFKSISGFLVQFMSQAEKNGDDPRESANELLSNSLAYHQATEAQKTVLREVFSYLQERILTLEPSAERRLVFARTVFDIPENQELTRFVNKAAPEISSATSIGELLSIFWPVIYKFNENSAIMSCKDGSSLNRAAKGWLDGRSFANIYSLFTDVKFGRFNATIDHIVDVCENGFGYHGSMIIGACIDLLFPDGEGDNSSRQLMRVFQKAVKYGLPTEEAIAAYEIGMTDRPLTMQLSPFIPAKASRRKIIASLRSHQAEIERIVESYPSYFSSKLREITE
jgi:hypothetical protein